MNEQFIQYIGGVIVAVDFKKTVEVATRIFHIKGYKNTNISEIAKAAGIATGSIYNFIKEKKSLIYYVVLNELDYDVSDIPFPVSDVDEKLVANQFMKIMEEFFSAIDHKKSHGYLEFRELISVIFDFTAKYSRSLNIINYNDSVFPITTPIYQNYVKKLYGIFENYVSYYIGTGRFRNIKYPKLHVRNIIEGIIWWTLDIPRFNDEKYDIEELKSIAIDTLIHAYEKK